VVHQGKDDSSESDSASIGDDPFIQAVAHAPNVSELRAQLAQLDASVDSVVVLRYTGQARACARSRRNSAIARRERAAAAGEWTRRAFGSVPASGLSNA
jgi:hypothetical protein